MISEEVYYKIVRSATMAPSGHNTQPWLFSKEEDSIIIMPDFKRSLPIADPENRELYISLGCAAETAMIAAKFYGYNPDLKIDLLKDQGIIRIILRKDEDLEQAELFPFIKLRQTTRNFYSDKPIPEVDLIKLKQIACESGFDLRFYFGQAGIKTLSPYIFEANAIQMNNPDFKKELIDWLRFSEKEAMQKGDGLFAACSGMPSMGRSVGSFVFRNIITAKSEEKRLLKQLDKTSVVAMFTTQRNDAEHWIKTGLAFQRFALTATKLTLSHSHINSPCQITEVRERMISGLKVDGEFPQLIIRLGYSKKMHFSIRRRINDVIIG